MRSPFKILADFDGVKFNTPVFVLRIDSASMVGRTRLRECRECEAPLLGRNLYIENLARLTLI